jgi:hypothetical protein
MGGEEVEVDEIDLAQQNQAADIERALAYRRRQPGPAARF